MHRIKTMSRMNVRKTK